MNAGIGLVNSLQEEKDLIEEAFWVNYNFDSAALAALSPDVFQQGIAIVDASGYRRKYLWDFFNAHYSCPLKEKVGILASDGDNGKWLCGVRSLLRRPGCVVYSVGSNGDVSFEQGILNRTECTVHVFDPTLTPHQKAAVDSVPGLHLHEYGLGDKDGWVSTGGDKSMTLGKKFDGFHVKSLPTIMKELGHNWIDVLKIDIEGAEWEVLDSILLDPEVAPFTQLQVEFHNWNDGKRPVTFMKSILQRMITKDLRVFSVEPNTWWRNNGYDFMEYSFLQVNHDGDVVTGRSKSEAAFTRRLLRS